jgi:mRNA interferase MazF
METPINPKRGEVWLVNFEPQTGVEIRKARPAVVISANEHARMPLRIIVPFTDWKEAYAQHYTKVHFAATTVNGLAKESAADAFQIKCFAVERFLNGHPLGRLTVQELEDVCIAIRIATGMDG